MLKINHFTNSFISVQSEKSQIICDPWIGVTNDNGWFSYPIKNFKEINYKNYKTNYIYISHLHCDHLDAKTLKKFKSGKVNIIIKKFKNGILKKRLQNITNSKIIELEPFKKKKINSDFTIAIIPQIISNSSNLPDNINYDLDTSILIQSNRDKTIFFNNVDTPINMNVLKKINLFVRKEFKRNIDIFCCALGAASEFPQCFLNINRNQEQKRIINESLDKIYRYLKYLKPKVFFPAGGTYQIYGKFYKLNKFIAQPTYEQIKHKTASLKTKIYNLIGGGFLHVKNGIIEVKQNDIKNENLFKKDFLKNIKNLEYYYHKKKTNINLVHLDKTFEKAKKNYFNILSHKKGIKTKWNIDFKIYKYYEINGNYLIDKNKSKYLKTYNLKNYKTDTNSIYNLECHLEYDLFQSLLKKKFPWNTSLSGSTIMYKRKPNKYNVDMVFSLNFLRV